MSGASALKQILNKTVNNEEWKKHQSEKTQAEVEQYGISYHDFESKQIAEMGKNREWYRKGVQGKHGHDFGKEDENKLAQNMRYRIQQSWEEYKKQNKSGGTKDQRKSMDQQMAEKLDPSISDARKAAGKFMKVLGQGAEALQQSTQARQAQMRALQNFQQAGLVAPQLIQQGTDQAARNALAMAKGGGRMGPSMGAALEGNQQAAAQSNQQASIAGAQENIAKQQALQAGYSGIRGMDMNMGQIGLQAGSMLSLIHI